MNLVNLKDTKLIHRNLLHSYILTIQDKKAIKETTSFIITTKRIKYLGINLPKEAKNLYSETFKILMKEIKGNTDREMFLD